MFVDSRGVPSLTAILVTYVRGRPYGRGLKSASRRLRFASCDGGGHAVAVTGGTGFVASDTVAALRSPDSASSWARPAAMIGRDVMHDTPTQAVPIDHTVLCGVGKSRRSFQAISR
jgi:hypothetical protein